MYFELFRDTINDTKTQLWETCTSPPHDHITSISSKEISTSGHLRIWPELLNLAFSQTRKSSGAWVLYVDILLSCLFSSYSRERNTILQCAQYSPKAFGLNFTRKWPFRYTCIPRTHAHYKFDMPDIVKSLLSS